MNRAAAVFLVLLRLTIGWHFLFEGLQKLHSHYVGETTTSKPFSSAGYFREAPGPVGWGWRWFNGTPDEMALARLQVAADEEDYKRLPPALAAQWRGLIERYAAHYGIDPEEADVKFKQHASDAVRWLEWQAPPALDNVRSRFGSLETVDRTLLTDAAEKAAYQEYLDNTTEQKRSFATGEVKRRMTMAERIEEYRRKLDEYNEQSGRKPWAFGKEVDKTGMKSARADLNKLREGLLADLEKTQTASFMQALNNLAAEPVAAPVGKLAGLLAEKDALLDKYQKQATDAAHAAAVAEADVVRKGDKATSKDLENRQKARTAAGAAKKTLGGVKAWAAALDKSLSKAASANKLLAPLKPAEAAAEDVKPIDLKVAHRLVGDMAAALPEATEGAEKAAYEINDPGDWWAWVGPLKVEALDIVARAKSSSEPVKKGLANLPETGPLKPLPPGQLIWWIDFLTRWGLTVIGACILVGFLARFNCWLGAIFLLITYLAVPAWPWLPSAGPSEGNYFLVNKNLVEMFALCVLGCLPTGRWFGADGMLRWLWNWFTGHIEDEAEAS